MIFGSEAAFRVVRWISVLLSVLLAHPSLAAAPQGSVSKLKIVVLEGEGAINNVRLRRAKEPVVEVQDEKGRPITGAIVTFVLPAHRAGGTFSDGQSSLTVITDERGQAAGRGLRPNRSVGQFQIRVTASYRGQTASANITQINAEPAGGRLSSKTILILALVAGAAAGGALAGLSGQKGSTSATPTNPSTPGTVITPGTPVIGPPQ